MKPLIIAFALVASLTALPAQAVKRVAYIYGDIAEDGTLPSGSLDAYDQMLLTDTGSHGCSMLKTLIENAGYQIDQYYDQATTLDATFLDQFDVIIFGLHQKVYSSTEKAALDTWLTAGGGMLAYSDSAAGGHYGIVGAQNQVGQTATNNLLADYGMQVLVDQEYNEITLQSGPNATHPIVAGNLQLMGEGVSPVAVDPTSGAEILIPYMDTSSEFLVAGNMRVVYQQGMTISSPLWAALAIQTVGDGHVVALFDRQPIWNDGPGANIQDADNAQILENVVKFLAGDLDSSSLAVSAQSEPIVSTAGEANLYGSLLSGSATSTTWSKAAGPGTVTFDDASALITTATFSAPGIYELQLAATNGSGSTDATVTIEVVDPSAIVHAINCGGGSLSATTGIAYSADDHYTGGHIDSFSGQPVAGTEDDSLYNEARSAMTSYNLPVANGKYLVELQFAETYFTTTGSRVFDTLVEGALASDDLDLVATAPGKFVAHNILLEVPVSDGSLDLTFSASQNNALLNAIVVAALPLRIEAEDFVGYYDTTSGNEGGQLHTTEDVDIGGSETTAYFVGWIAEGEYLDYAVDVPTTGNYNFSFRVGTANTDDKTFHLEVDGVNISGPITFNTEGAGWETWQDVPALSIPLEAGVQTIRVVMDSNNFNIDFFEIAPSSATGTVFEMTDFVGYSDTTSGNQGGELYLTEDVDIGGNETTGYFVGWIDSGEYLDYAMDVPTAGNYRFSFRVGTANTDTKTFHLEVGGVDISGPITFNTGGAGWESWQDVAVPSVALGAGEQTLRVVMDSSYFNMKSFEITPAY